jgi:hypothetical protein
MSTTRAQGIQIPIVEMPDDFAEFNEEAVRRRWSDGFPLIPPTEERVQRFVDAIPWRDRHEVIETIAPGGAVATVEMIAVQAVMAGCLPEVMPLLVTTVETMCDPAVNLYGSQATTHPCAILALVSGPVAKTAGLFGGAGLYGPGPEHRGNVAFGRAVRLICQNVGGAYPGTTDRSTQGSPAKYSFAFCENEEESPWEPYRVAQGFDEGVSTVTVMAADPPHGMHEGVSIEPTGLLVTFCQSIAMMGKNNSYIPGTDYFLVLCPEHAKVLSDHGFTRRDVQEYLFNRARIPYSEWKQGGAFGMFANRYPKYLQYADDALGVPMSLDPTEVQVVVGGGAGRHSSFIASVGISRQVTRQVDVGPPA